LRQAVAPMARAAAPSDDRFRINAPQISLPKGGGAIRGVDEKFAANTVTGSGSMTVPIPTSSGRSSFGPQLSLSYDSSAGNGAFGFGWKLALPSITRRTDKGLPRYRDAEESDVFIISGAEDLVPVYREDLDGSWVAAHPGYQRDAQGSWVRDDKGRLVVHEDDSGGYRIRGYRPLKGCLHASSDGRASTARTLTGDRSRPTTSRRSTAAHRTVGLLTCRTPPGFSAGRSVRATMIKATPSSTSTRRRMPIT